MTKSQRRVLQAIGVLIALASVAVGIAVVDGDSSDQVAVRTGDDSFGATDSSTVTTVDLAPVTASTRPPDRDPPPHVTEPPPTTAPPGDIVTHEGAVLARPDLSTPRPMVSDCRSLAEDGWTARSCDRVAARGADLVWLIQERGNRLRALVLRPSTAGTWVVILASPDGTRWQGIRVAVADVSGDGPPEIAFGFSRADSGQLDIDLVEGPGRVVVHAAVTDGVARVRPLQFETWEPVSSDPATYDHSVIRFDGGAYRRIETGRVPASSVPDGDL